MLIHYPVCTHDLVKAMCCNIKGLISEHSAFSISHCPGAATRILETCTHIIPMPEGYHVFTPLKYFTYIPKFCIQTPTPHVSS